MPGTSNDLNISQPGYVAFDGIATFYGRTFQAGAGITLSNADGISGNTTIGLSGGAAAIEKINMQAGTTPILPTGGIITFNGSTVVAGTNPVRTNGTAIDTMALQIQISQALAATDATKIGLSNYDSSKFTVDANGFVSTSGTGIANTITGDNGGALSPTSGNWNILGGPGVTTSGSGSTLTINSVVFTDQGSSITVASDNGYFITGNFAMTLPASPAQGEMVIIYADTTSTVTITANTGQVIRLGSNVTASAGSITSGARGDSMTFRYRSSGSEWNTVGSTGGWIF